MCEEVLVNNSIMGALGVMLLLAQGCGTVAPPSTVAGTVASGSNGVQRDVPAGFPIAFSVEPVVAAELADAASSPGHFPAAVRVLATADVRPIGLVGGVGFVDDTRVWVTGALGDVEMDVDGKRLTRQIEFGEHARYSRGIAYTRTATVDGVYVLVPRFGPHFPEQTFRVLSPDGDLLAEHPGAWESTWSVPAPDGTVLTSFLTKKPAASPDRDLQWVHPLTGMVAAAHPAVDLREERCFFRFFDGRGSWNATAMSEESIAFVQATPQGVAVRSTADDLRPKNSPRLLVADVYVSTPVDAGQRGSVVPPHFVQYLKRGFFGDTSTEGGSVRIGGAGDGTGTVTAAWVPDEHLDALYVFRSPDIVWTEFALREGAPKRVLIAGHAIQDRSFIRIFVADTNSGRTTLVGTIRRPDWQNHLRGWLEGREVCNARWINEQTLRVIGVTQGAFFVADIDLGAGAGVE